MKLGLREANQHFSKAIRAVRAGKEVVLTERGRPIAVIAPFKERDGQRAAFQAMADEGLLRPAPRKGPMAAPRWQSAKVTGRPISDTVIDNRNESD